MAFDGSIGHMEDLSGPWGNSGGVVKTIEDVEAMAQTGVAWIEDGSQTLQPRLGLAVDPENPEGPRRKVYTHNPETGQTGNALGMPGQGMDVVVPELRERQRIAHSHGKNYILNVAPVTSEPLAETVELVTRAYETDIDAVLVNAGCPNVEVDDSGGRMELLSRSEEKLESVLYALRPVVERFKPVVLRISPQESFAQARRIYKIIRDSRVVSAVFVPNTWPNYIPADEEGQPILKVNGGAGGLSGPAIAQQAREQTMWATRFTRMNDIDIVSSAGIMNASELKVRLNMDAKGGAGTTFYYEPVDGWEADTDKLLKELSEL
jgi:dihydroorotate dehydrogenase